MATNILEFGSKRQLPSSNYTVCSSRHCRPWM